MTELTDRQRRKYASAEPGEVDLVTLTFRHPAWPAPWHLTNSDEAFEGLIDGELVTFTPHPFELDLPEIGADGKVDLGFNLMMTGAVMVEAIEVAARDARVPIEVEFNAYSPGDTAPQMTALRLQLAALPYTPLVASGTAASADFLNQEFPRGIYTLAAFPALDRG